jgi:hypothetical protein
LSIGAIANWLAQRAVIYFVAGAFAAIGFFAWAAIYTTLYPEPPQSHLQEFEEGTPQLPPPQQIPDPRGVEPVCCTVNNRQPGSGQQPVQHAKDWFIIRDREVYDRQGKYSGKLANISRDSSGRMRQLYVVQEFWAGPLGRSVTVLPAESVEWWVGGRSSEQAISPAISRPVLDYGHDEEYVTPARRAPKASQ